MSPLFALAMVSAGVPSHSYPPYVHKELYASKDIRGKMAPKIVVEKWLTGGAPSTKGKVVLVDMWATWCPPCRELITELNAWQKKFGNKLCVIGISSEKASTVTDFMKSKKMNYSVGVDTRTRLQQLIGVGGIPHVIVISPDGIVRWQGFPLSNEDPLTSDKLGDIISVAEKG